MAIDEDTATTPGVLRPPRWRRNLEVVVEELRERGLGEFERAHWNPSAEYGGEVAVLPPGIDEGGFVADFVSATRSTLARLNAVAGSERIRLRMALHQGITQLDDEGFGGRAVRKVAALRDCPELRAELRAGPAADLAVAVSMELFDDAVEHDYPGLRGRDFRRTRVRLAPGEHADAWLLMAAAPVQVPVHPPAGAGGWPAGLGVRQVDAGTQPGQRSGTGTTRGGGSTGQVRRLVLVSGASSRLATGSRHAR